MSTTGRRAAPGSLRGPRSLRVQCAAAAISLIVLAMAGGAAAQTSDYPTRPVRWIVGFPAGGSSDIVARILSDWLQARLGQTVLIENKPGAGSNIAAEAVVNAPPDGHTLLSVTSANAINATVNKRTLSFDLLKQIAPVAGSAYGPSVMVVHPSVPATTVAEFIAYAKANPGKINMGSAGAATTSHMAGELFKAMAAIDLVHVPYRGSAPALTDLVGGQVQVMFDALISTLPHIQSGKLRALGVTTAARSQVLSNVPTIAETVPGYEATHLVRRRRPAGDARQHHRQAEPGIQRWAGLGEDQIAARRARFDADRGEPERVRRLRQVRDREVGEGDQALRHQGGLTFTAI